MAFVSAASDLVDDDTNGYDDAFVHDRQTGTTTRVSVRSDGTQADSLSFNTVISPDDSTVAFETFASLDPADNNPGSAGPDVFVHVRATAETTLVSLRADGSHPTNAGGCQEDEFPASSPSLSGDGRYVAFESYFQDLVPNDDNNRCDVFVRDRLAGTTTLVSATPAGRVGLEYSWEPALSANGQVIAFESGAEDLVRSDANGGYADIFVLNRLPSYIKADARRWFGRRRGGGYAEDPVNTATGNFTHAEVDLDFPPAIAGLALERTYNALDGTEGALGVGWSLGTKATVEQEPDGDVSLWAGDGRLVHVEARTGGGWDRPEELFGDLGRDPDGSLRIDYDDGSREDFDAQGRLEQRTTWDAQSVTLAYDASSRLVSATHSAGYSISFSYRGDGRLERAESSDGRVVTYGYDADGDLATVAGPHPSSYVTDGEGLITEVRDGDGVVKVANTYDEEGRVATQVSPGADNVTFTYDDAAGTTTLTRATSGAQTRYGHDEAGRLTSITDAHGAVMSQSYDGDGNLVSATDRRGAAMSQSFDTHGNVATRTSPEGVTDSFTYDASDRLLSATNGEGEVTTFAYQGAERLPMTVTDPTAAVTAYDVGSDGLVHAVTDPDGIVTTFGYDAKRNLTTSVDAAGKITTYGYDAAGNLTSEATPLANTTTTSYDAARRVTAITDPTGATTSAAFSTAGRPTATTGAAGKITTYAHDGAGRLSSTTDAGGGVTTMSYDLDGNVVSVTRPGGATTTTTSTFDALGRRLSSTDPTGVTTTYGYDADGNPTTTTDAAGQTTTATYDGRGRLTRRADPLGHATTYAYDKADRLTSMVDPTSATTAYAYDDLGRPTAVTDARGGVTAKSYTPAGRLDRTTDANVNATTYAYDTRGRLATSTDALAGITSYAYDDDGRLSQVTSPAGLPTTYAYDGARRVRSLGDPATGTAGRTYTARGELATVTDATSGVRRFAYDPLGRLAKATDALGRDTTFGYDARGNLVTRTDAKGKVQTYGYDLADRLTASTDPLNRTTTQSYDALGRLAGVADPSGRSVSLGYAAAARLTTRTHTKAGSPTVAVSYAYDAADRRTSMTDPTGTTTWSYDVVGNLTSTTAGAKTLGYSWDLGGRRSSLSYPEGSAAGFAYDANDRLVGLSHPAAGAVAYTYDADGRVLSEDLPGTDARAYSYDSGGRMATYAETLAGETRTTTVSHDAAGRISAESTVAPLGPTTVTTTAAYGYDAAGQLTGVTRGSRASAKTTTYRYDNVGNRTAKTGLTNTSYSYDDANQLKWARTRPQAADTAGDVTGIYPAAEDVVVSFTHDGAGRMTGASSPAGSRALAYDAKGSLASVTGTLGPLSNQSARTTDGDGRLVGISFTGPTGTTTTGLTWDPGTAVPQLATTSTGGANTDYLFGLGRELAIRGGQGDAVARDVHGSSVARGEAADLARAGAYDEFGRPVVTSAQGLVDEVLGAVGIGGDQSLRFGYRGEAIVNGMVNLRARDYATGLGRFTTVDPLAGTPGEVSVANPYPYAANDPVDQMDPLGLSPVRDGDLRLNAAISLSINDRRDAMTDFFEAFAGDRTSGPAGFLGIVGDYPGEDAGLGLGVLQFFGWEVSSGRLDSFTGSAWWRAVNGRMVLDIQEAHALIRAHGIVKVSQHLSGTSAGALAWVAYAVSATGPSSGAARQTALWRAHQCSLHSGITAAADLLGREEANERRFAALVVRNADLAALNNFSTRDGFIGGYVTRAYPKYNKVRARAAIT